MLVLTRKVDETICVGDNITVTVVRVSGNKVRIGIDAPSHVHIRRGELPSRTAPPTVIEATIRVSDSEDQGAPDVEPPAWPVRAALNLTNLSKC